METIDGTQNEISKRFRALQHIHSRLRKARARLYDKEISFLLAATGYPRNIPFAQICKKKRYTFSPIRDNPQLGEQQQHQQAAPLLCGRSGISHSSSCASLLSSNTRRTGRLLQSTQSAVIGVSTIRQQYPEKALKGKRHGLAGVNALPSYCTAPVSAFRRADDGARHAQQPVAATALLRKPVAALESAVWVAFRDKQTVPSQKTYPEQRTLATRESNMPRIVSAVAKIVKGAAGVSCPTLLGKQRSHNRCAELPASSPTSFITSLQLNQRIQCKTESATAAAAARITAQARAAAHRCAGPQTCISRDLLDLATAHENARKRTAVVATPEGASLLATPRWMVFERLNLQQHPASDPGAHVKSDATTYGSDICRDTSTLPNVPEYASLGALTTVAPQVPHSSSVTGASNGSSAPGLERQNVHAEAARPSTATCSGTSPGGQGAMQNMVSQAQRRQLQQTLKKGRNCHLADVSSRQHSRKVSGHLFRSSARYSRAAYVNDEILPAVRSLVLAWKNATGALDAISPADLRKSNVRSTVDGPPPNLICHRKLGRASSLPHFSRTFRQN